MSMKKVISLIWGCIIALTMLASCASPGTTTETKQDYWPTEQWRTSDPAKQGVDLSVLSGLEQYISDFSLRIDSILVVRNGYIVYEKYFNALYDKETKHIMYSCTKSVLGALVGIAEQEGSIDSLDHKVLDYFQDRTVKNLDERKQAMTLKHLLSMTAGVTFSEWSRPYTDPQNDYIKAVTSPDVVQYILDLPMAVDPGTVWNYCGGYTDLLGAIVVKVTKSSTLDYANRTLFTPLGIKDVSWSKNASGLYNVAGGLSLTPRDQAKFGLMYLHGGKWDGKQIVPADFVAESVKTQHSFSYSSGYGWESWWTYPLDNYFTCQGIYGQRIAVVPDKDLVVVFSANMTNTDPTPPENTIMHTYILPACK